MESSLPVSAGVAAAADPAGHQKKYTHRKEATTAGRKGVVLRASHRDAAGRRLDPECCQLLEYAARTGVPLTSGASQELLVTDEMRAAVAPILPSRSQV